MDGRTSFFKSTEYLNKGELLDYINNIKARVFLKPLVKPRDESMDLPRVHR